LILREGEEIWQKVQRKVTAVIGQPEKVMGQGQALEKRLIQAAPVWTSVQKPIRTV
jgi:hypothetical protein